MHGASGLRHGAEQGKTPTMDDSHARTSSAVTWFGMVPGSVPLVLLHGFTGSPASWSDVVCALPGSRTIAALSLPGHHPAMIVRHGFEANVDAVAEVLAMVSDGGVRASPCHLVGYSLGARVALSLAVRHPALVLGLTLVGVHPGLHSQTERAERVAADARLAALLRAGGVDAFVRAWEAQPLFATQARASAHALAAQRRIRRAHDPEALAQSLEHLGLGVMPSYRDALARIRVPVTLVTGELDVKFSGLARELAAQAPGVSLALVPACGHNPLLEQPAALAALIEPM